MTLSKSKQQVEKKSLVQQTTDFTPKKKGGLELTACEMETLLSQPVITLTCERCGKEYTKKRYQVRKALKNGFKHTYCSRECSCAIINENQLQGKCAVCGKPINARLKYCSTECRSKSTARILPQVNCPVCGKEFRPRSHRTIYC